MAPDREKISYRLVRGDRKTIAIQIQPNGDLIVRAPRRMSASAIDQFVSSKRGWIEKHLPKPGEVLARFTEEEIQTLGQQALSVIPKRVEHFAPLVGVSYGNITIRSQRTRWGSCSSRGNLNFNCLLMLVPEKVRDYVVVHELCHRKEMNHSPRFWAEVEKILPDYRESRRWLKENGQALIGRLG